MSREAEPVETIFRYCESCVDKGTLDCPVNRDRASEIAESLVVIPALALVGGQILVSTATGIRFAEPTKPQRVVNWAMTNSEARRDRQADCIREHQATEA